MKMKQRIFITNTTMVLFSLLILLGLGAIMVGLFKNEIMTVIGENSDVAPNNYEVQTILRQATDYDGNWEDLSDDLSVYGYNLYVTDEANNELYSNIKHSEWECIEELQKSSEVTQDVSLYCMENVTIAKTEIIQENQGVILYATYYPGKLSRLGMDKGMFEMFITVFIMVGIIAIIGLLLGCLAFTKMLIRKVLVPVEELGRAAKRIDEGNFNEEIEYHNKDEFFEVCTAFNTMQLHLKEGIEQSKAYERARTDMVSGISHDLRTPLTSVKGYIKGLKDGIANTPEKQERYLEIAYRKACDMDELLQKLFYFSKLETGNLPFYKHTLEFNQWIRSYVENLTSECEEKNFEVNLKTDANTHLVDMDVEQMKRVFDNLIDNSMKYADSSSLVITIEVLVPFDGQADHLEIRISDNGKGIDDDKLEHLFEQFYRGDESRNSQKEGSGLGLYVCKYIVEEHGGTVEAKNKNGFMIVIQLPKVNIENEEREGVADV